MNRAEINKRIERAKFERDCYQRSGGLHKVKCLEAEIAELTRQRDALPPEEPVRLPPVEEAPTAPPKARKGKAKKADEGGLLF